MLAAREVTGASKGAGSERERLNYLAGKPLGGNFCVRCAGVLLKPLQARSCNVYHPRARNKLRNLCTYCAKQDCDRSVNFMTGPLPTLERHLVQIFSGRFEAQPVLPSSVRA